MNKKMYKSGFTPLRTGFTLVELLVSIGIIALLLGVGLPNFAGARSRARDAKRKADLLALKDALRMYYNDYQRYPVSDDGTIRGCGPNGNDYRCPNTCLNGEWAAGGNIGCTVVYMKKMPQFNAYQYPNPRNPDDMDDFLLKVRLDNVNDGDIDISQRKCGNSTIEAGYYYVCAD